jgi:hypothetical protein
MDSSPPKEVIGHTKRVIDLACERQIATPT